MKYIHNKLLEKSRAYSKWHDHAHHNKIHWGAILVALGVATLLALNGIQSWRNTLYNIVMIELSPRSAALTLDPQTKSVKEGDSFIANIILDTDGKPVDGVDLYSLHYDPTILSVVDASTKAGVQITPGVLMDVTAMNTVDPKTGVIKFSQTSTAGTNFTGKGVLASIQFKAVAKGSS